MAQELNDQVIADIKTNGFSLIKNFIDEPMSCIQLQEYLSKAEKFSDGVITDIPSNLMSAIHLKISSLIPDVSRGLGLSTASDNFGYSAIRIQEDFSAPVLKKPFNLHQDPKVSPGGLLNWHLDHFSYYLYHDHINFLICYIPIFKPSKSLTNLAIVPQSAVEQHDPYLFSRIAGRGAMRFRCAEADTLEWFRMRFPDEEIHVGDWFAIDDYDDSSMGFKLKIDLEAQKVVPELDQFDLLIMRADVIHRTNDTDSNRISVRCDAIPSAAPRLDTLAGLICLTSQYLLMGSKRRYNIRKWLRKAWMKRVSTDNLNDEIALNPHVYVYLKAFLQAYEEVNKTVGSPPNELQAAARFIEDLLSTRDLGIVIDDHEGVLPLKSAPE